LIFKRYRTTLDYANMVNGQQFSFCSQFYLFVGLITIGIFSLVGLLAKKFSIIWQSYAIAAASILRISG